MVHHYICNGCDTPCEIFLDKKTSILYGSPSHCLYEDGDRAEWTMFVATDIFGQIMTTPGII